VLRLGDVFAVNPGQTVATDGVVISGATAIDTSLVTGEPVPVDVTVGDSVVGGTVNTNGHVLVRATAVGSETALARITALVTAAQTGKAPIARLGDRISAVFVPVVICLAILTFAAWMLFSGDVHAAFLAGIAVLIIACPCALGLATPTAILVGTGRGAQMGVLIRGPEILERTRQIDTVVLDKTGTVTAGKMSVEGVILSQAAAELGLSVDQVLQLAAAVESQSEHPIAKAIVAAGSGVPSYFTEIADQVRNDIAEFRAHPGGGVTAHVGLASVAVGKLDWLRGLSIRVDDDVVQSVATAELNGATTVVVALETPNSAGIKGEDLPQSNPKHNETRAATQEVGSNLVAVAVVELRDPPKATSAQAVAELKALGLRPLLLTGDSQGAALATAAAVGIAALDVRARVLPEQKAEVIRQLQSEGHLVAMVGDGINDAAALASADLGLAMGTGTDAAIEASDITLVQGDLRSAPAAVRLSRKTLRIIKQNLFWAFFYNVAAIPLAAAGVLNPMIAGGAMALSSVLVVLNSLRLRAVR
jgi:Cu+-exporting ATPase